MESHSLMTRFEIGHMEDEFTFQSKSGGIINLTRTTNIFVPAGLFMTLRCWAIGRSIRSVHKYVYNNIKMA